MASLFQRTSSFDQQPHAPVEVTSEHLTMGRVEAAQSAPTRVELESWYHTLNDLLGREIKEDIDMHTRDLEDLRDEIYAFLR